MPGSSTVVMSFTNVWRSALASRLPVLLTTPRRVFSCVTRPDNAVSTCCCAWPNVDVVQRGFEAWVVGVVGVAGVVVGSAAAVGDDAAKAAGVAAIKPTTTPVAVAAAATRRREAVRHVRNLLAGRSGRSSPC